MTIPLPQTPEDLMRLTWADFQPYIKELAGTKLTAQNVNAWLSDWSRVSECLDELYNRLYVAVTVNTVDQESETRYKGFLDEIYPQAMQAEQTLKEKLLASGLEPEGFALPLKKMRAETDLFREENVPLLAEEQKLNSEYDRIVGAQTVQWDGQEQTVYQMRPHFMSNDRSLREQAWRLTFNRTLEDRKALNELWAKMLDLRRKVTAHAGRSSYRAYRWQQLLRFDYTPDDCVRFQDAIEKAVVPVASRIYERRRQKLGVETLRPWDLDVDLTGLPPLHPFTEVSELKAGVSSIFHKVHPQLGEYFDTMVRENLLDLDNRKNKAPGGYCTSFSLARKPFIFTNAVGVHDDVQTLLHEGGHSFHVFETAQLPYLAQLNVPMEFAEVASMAMEQLAGPYLEKSQGGFYTAQEAARARVEFLEGAVLFWPYMAVVDAFQHWVYENPDHAAEPANCDARWSELWQRFMPGVDWSGLEDLMAAGWQRKPHIFESPFYYVEYGLAQLGAAQVWRNSLRNQASAVDSYRKALSLGGTVSLPELYLTAGARLAFDADTLGQSVKLMEDTILKLSE